MNAKLSLPLFLLLGAAPAAAQVAFGPATSEPVGPLPDGLVFADFDGDLDRDLAATADNPDRVVVRFNTGNGTFVAAGAVQTGGGTGPHIPVAGDLDGDTDIDIAVTLKNVATVRVLLNAGNGTFTLGSSTSVGTDARSIAIGDLDNDGDLDLVTANRDGGSVSILRNAGNATFTVSTIAPVNEPREIVIAQLTGDNLRDVAVAVHDDDQVRVFRNTGGAAFVVHANLTIPGTNSPEGLAAGDMDGNGFTDLVASADNNNVERVHVFFNTNGTFGAGTTTTHAGLDTSSLTVADFDVDGDLDLAAANTGSNNVTVLENTGGGSLGNQQQLAVGGQPNHIANADVDGNGSPDLGTANESTGDVSILRSQASGCGVIRTYCTAKAGLACGTPSIASTGTPSASATSGFDITAAPARADRTGVLLYNTAAQTPAVPFQGGLLCVQSSGIRRAGPASSGGTATCDGVFSIDMNTFAAGLWPQPSNNPAPFLSQVGQRVNVQWWGRDTVATGSFLSNAMEYTVCP